MLWPNRLVVFPDPNKGEDFCSGFFSSFSTLTDLSAFPGLSESLVSYFFVDKTPPNDAVPVSPLLPNKPVFDPPNNEFCSFLSSLEGREMFVADLMPSYFELDDSLGFWKRPAAMAAVRSPVNFYYVFF